jgi:hypothetical protein
VKDAAITGKTILLNIFLKTVLYVLAAGYTDQTDIKDLQKNHA